MTLFAGFVLACDERGCPQRYFHVGAHPEDAAREAFTHGWRNYAGLHRCAAHADAFARRN